MVPGALMLVGAIRFKGRQAGKPEIVVTHKGPKQGKKRCPEYLDMGKLWLPREISLLSAREGQRGCSASIVMNV